ncbi:hypothetical protein [uncultured Brevundimonas sp.]|uniref:hypothetical protein n=1 Tax=uncultured Brevundimonas sp. TaxID=213418 RepID=UPI0030EC337C|tara:strand:- start:3148 stop:3414 length:267 start_codon:yes stop_codon:yes gene_type:complete
MSERWTFARAADFWHRHYRADPEAVWDRFISAEKFILDRTPRTTDEAEIIFEVLLEQGLDGRGDGRDLKALQSLHHYVRQLHHTLIAA